LIDKPQNAKFCRRIKGQKKVDSVSVSLHLFLKNDWELFSLREF